MELVCSELRPSQARLGKGMPQSSMKKAAGGGGRSIVPGAPVWQWGVQLCVFGTWKRARRRRQRLARDAASARDTLPVSVDVKKVAARFFDQIPV
jgi:hypothetical protein